MAADELEWIRLGLAKPGKSRAGLAAAIGRAPSAVTAMLQGKRDLKVREIRKIAEYLETAAPLVEPASIPVVGIAGAGPNGSVLYGEGDGGLGGAPVPPGWTEETVALEVRGASMRGVAFDGWFIYYDDRRSPLTDDMLGEPCVIGLADGQVLVKTPYQGRGPGLFDLESSNPAFPTMRDVRVEWAALVTAIIPRKSTKNHPRSVGEAVA